MKPLTKGLLTVFILAVAVGLSQREDPSSTLNAEQLPPNQVKIDVDGDVRLIQSNGIPDHKPGTFPNRHNPNTIRAQQYQFRMPVEPRKARSAAMLGMNLFGVALNGVPFDPGAAEYWNRDRNSGWQYEALSVKIDLGLDASNAHVQPNGAYHYHGVPIALLARLSGKKKQMSLVGYAADGFPVYALFGYSDRESAESEVRKLDSSYRLKKGTRPSGPGGRYDGTFVEDYEYVEGAGDLDECNGREGVTPEHPDGTYYYVLTAGYPFIPRYLKGTSDASFLKRGPPPGGRRGPGGPPGGRPPR
jgi:hypothetical protein